MSNKRTISLLVDGMGCQEVEIATGTTLKQLADAFDLAGYTFTIDNEIVPPMNWDSFKLDGVSAVWGTKGQKGAC